MIKPHNWQVKSFTQIKGLILKLMDISHDKKTSLIAYWWSLPLGRWQCSKQWFRKRYYTLNVNWIFFINRKVLGLDHELALAKTKANGLSNAQEGMQGRGWRQQNCHRMSKAIWSCSVKRVVFRWDYVFIDTVYLMACLFIRNGLKELESD